MKILFCFYPLYVKYNNGIALLSALCKERGIETELYVLDDTEKFDKHLRGNKYDYIGFSCVTAHDYRKCLPFINIARNFNKAVLLGGVYARGEGRQIDAPVDYICRGEGEMLPDFILSGDDRLFNEKMLCEDIDGLPLPDYGMFRDILFERTELLKGKALPYQSSRGCPHRCSFCEVNLQPAGVRFRYKVKEDLRFLAAKYSPDYFFMGDAMLPYYNPSWRESWGDFRHPFFAYIRADIREELLVWLHDRGMMACAFGVESGDEKYRNEVLGKMISDEQINNTVRMLKELGIKYAPFFMSDTPGETFSIKAKTHNMIKAIGGFPFIWKYENLFV